MSKYRPILYAIFWLLTMFGAFFLGGAYVGSRFWVANNDLSRVFGSDLDLVTGVYNTIEDNFLGEIDNKTLTYQTIKGMVAGLGDPYTEFFDPEDTKSFWEDLDGNFEGVGLEMTMKDGKAVVVSVLADSPAIVAGLKPNDIILAVDNEDVSGKTLSEIANIIKGPENSVVVLYVLRGDELLEFSITRKRLVADSVMVERDNDILWVRVIRFDEDSDQELIGAIKEYDLSQINGLVLDMRGNPGGYFDASLEMADMFIGEGLLLMEKDKSGNLDEFYAEYGDELEQIKMVVLIDAGSASAAEIVTGAIKDNNRGKIVGKKSFGKGSVQVIEEFEDGSMLKITQSEWLTPKGVNLRKDGIEPDVVVDWHDGEVDAQYVKAKEVLLSE